MSLKVFPVMFIIFTAYVGRLESTRKQILSQAAQAVTGAATGGAVAGAGIDLRNQLEKGTDKLDEKEKAKNVQQGLQFGYAVAQDQPYAQFSRERVDAQKKPNVGPTSGPRNTEPQSTTMRKMATYLAKSIPVPVHPTTGEKAGKSRLPTRTGPDNNAYIQYPDSSSSKSKKM